mmetsp:Transcript_135089/g.328328  ORF Transcript_135089/g.328328 Transcript_135089/m.328328 type:complete len:237 (-) Transcript_135089:86-796(-)
MQLLLLLLGAALALGDRGAAAGHRALASEGSALALQGEAAKGGAAAASAGSLRLIARAAYGGAGLRAGSGGGSGLMQDDAATEPHTMGLRKQQAVEAGNGFCSGMATSMHMRGFTSLLGSGQGPRECVVFLFPSWVLDTPHKFALGCLGAMLLGVAAEFALALELRRAAAGCSLPTRLALHATTLALGYALMLLVMVYSVELTVAAIAGLVAGRGLFGPAKETSAKSPTGPTPCCG